MGGSLELAGSVISFVKILFICVETVARFPLLPAKITKFKFAQAPSKCEPKHSINIKVLNEISLT